MDVECLDIDNVALKYIEQQATRDQLQGIKTRLIDFDNDRWCYAHETVGAVINVDYFSRNLMDKFNRSVRVGGYVLFETISGRGGNYLELPDEKEVSACFGDHFEFLYYCEKKVGPSSCKAVTVKMVAKKKSVS